LPKRGNKGGVLPKRGKRGGFGKRGEEGGLCKRGGNEMELWSGIKREIFQRGKNKMGLCRGMEIRERKGF